MFNHLRIVLVGTTHPGNIGSAARAMKTMGFTRLYLVSPKTFPHGEAIAMAAGADDILENAVVVETLDDAIADCHYVMGASARLRTLSIPVDTAHDSALSILKMMDSKEIAIVFGRESSGLTNDELLKCHHHIHIPTVTHFGSLNLAAAVQVICYEIRMAYLQYISAESFSVTAGSSEPLATAEEREGFYRQLEETLQSIEFIKSTNLHSLMHRLRRLFQRNLMEQVEVNILRGILTAVQRKISEPLS